MKCDKLIDQIKQADDDYKRKGVPIHLDIRLEDLLDAFAELKAENSRLKTELDLWRDGNIIREETLNELESTKRVLWRAISNWAMAEFRLQDYMDEGSTKWLSVRNNAIAKVEEYK